MFHRYTVRLRDRVLFFSMKIELLGKDENHIKRQVTRLYGESKTIENVKKQEDITKGNIHDRRDKE